MGGKCSKFSILTVENLPLCSTTPFVVASSAAVVMLADSSWLKVTLVCVNLDPPPPCTTSGGGRGSVSSAAAVVFVVASGRWLTDDAGRPVSVTATPTVDVKQLMLLSSTGVDVNRLDFDEELMLLFLLLLPWDSDSLQLSPPLDVDRRAAAAAWVPSSLPEIRR